MTFQETRIIPQKHGRRNFVCHLYPNSYGIGMSNLGFQKIFQLWNEGEDDLIVERAFLPEEFVFPATAKPKRIYTHESGSNVKNFPVLSVSVSYEMDYVNFLRFLLLNGIPLRKEERTEDDPVIIVGGAAVTINPLPIAPFADFLVIGEGETVLPKIRERFAANMGEREKLLTSIRNLPGIFWLGKKEVTERLYEPTLTSPTASTFLTEETVFADTYLVELGRGCGAHCRFCTAGYIYRPVRFYSESLLRETVRKGAGFTKKMGLFASDVMGHPNLKELLAFTASEGLTTTLSSFRLDRYDPEIVRLLKENSCKSLTIAPEAGSEGLRRSLNKPIGNDELYARISEILDEEMFHLKLYFLIGLPGETRKDVEEMVAMTAKVQQIMASKGKKYGWLAGITVGFNIVIPKPVTPYFSLLPDEISETKRKIDILKRIQRIPNVKLQLPSLHLSLLASIVSNGDEQIAGLLEEYASSGIDSSQHAADGKKVRSVRELHALATELLKGNKAFDRINAAINYHVDPQYLVDEMKRGEKGIVSPDCLDMKKCTRCGLSC